MPEAQDASTERVPCPLCESEAGETLANEDALALVRCADCTHAYTSPRLKAEALTDAYARHVYRPPTGGEDPAWGAWVRRTRAWRVKVALRHSPPPPKGNVLEIGCGVGDILAEIARRGHRVFGVELDRVAAAEAVRALGPDAVTTEPIERVDRDASFDLALLFSVLEHVPDPVAFLKEVRRLLKPGGRVLLHVPNLTVLLARHRRGRPVSWDLVYHLQAFSIRTLHRTLKSAGFVPTGQFWHERPYVSSSRGALVRLRVGASALLRRAAWELTCRRWQTGSSLNVIAART